MEQSVRDCCRSIRIGKILIHSDEDTHDAKVVYSKLPPDIDNRKVLLLYPIGSQLKILYYILLTFYVYQFLVSVEIMKVLPVLYKFFIMFCLLNISFV